MCGTRVSCPHLPHPCAVPLGLGKKEASSGLRAFSISPAVAKAVASDCGLRLATQQLGDLRQAAWTLCASVSSFIKDPASS